MSTTTPTREDGTADGAAPDAPATGRASVPRPSRRRTDPLYHLFLLPALALFTLAVTLPAVLGFAYSFTNSIGFGDWDVIGLRNYIAMFRDQGILDSYLFTLGFALVTVVLVNALAFLLAWVLAGSVAIAWHFYGGGYLGSAIVTGLTLWAGFTAGRFITHDVFAGRPSQLTILNISYELVLVLVMSVIIGVWPPAGTV